jgi:hypothetical protein
MDRPPYRCGTALRRATVVAKGGWNGIDYLEVDPNSDINVPLTLRVMFLKADGLAALGKDHFRISGGVRYRDPSIQNAAQIAAGSRIVLLTLPAPLLTDYSTYTLHLVTPGTDAPPSNFDPQLAAVQFSFKINCPSPFDCVPQERPATPPPAPEPDLDYGARDWASFRRLMLDRLAALLPGFRDDTPADFLVTQVELLAYVADHLSYKLDAITTEQTPWTARSRISLARHARLLDYPVHEGCNARCFVRFEYQSAASAVLERATPLLPSQGSSPVTLTPDALARLLPADPIVFETMHDLMLIPGNNAIDFFTWSETLCTLPRGATAATLKLQRSPTDPAALLVTGDFLLLAQTRSPVTGHSADADRSRRHVVRLTSVLALTDPIEALQLLQVGWDLEDALPFDLPLSADVPQPGQPSLRIDCAQAAGNIALADHGVSLPPRKVSASAAESLRPQLYPPEAPASGRWRPRLSRRDLVRAAPLDLTTELSAYSAMNNDPAEALPAVTLLDSFSTWNCRHSLLTSERFDRDVVMETEHDGTVQLRFGDNVLGVAPLAGSRFTVSGRFGRALDGNIGTDVLRHVVTGVSGITALNNPLQASGGVAPLAPAVIRIEAPQAFRTQQRAVTEADWADVAERHPEVAKAVARIRWTGAWRTAFVYVDRKGGLPVEPDIAFRTRMLRHLEGYRLAGIDLALRGPRMVALDLALKICVRPGVLRAAVLRALLERLATGMMRDGRHGLFHPDNFTFGSPLYLSALIAAVLEVPDVASAEPVRFQRWAKAPVNELAQGVIRAGETEILQLDNDPNFPENGRLQLELLGGV